MNERFFDLKKDRQDRIINGAMRIFAQNGYRHASTDEMVAAASISKGLLFHYFKSKKGTWEFLYEYSTRYTLLELREAQRRRGCDLFEMYRQLVRVDAAILQKYPHMPLFLRRADEELGTDVEIKISFKYGSTFSASTELAAQMGSWYTDGTEVSVDGLFCLRNAIAPATVLKDLALDEAHIIVNRAMETNLPGVFAAGDCTGRPYQIAKSVGEGNIAAHTMIEYLAK